MAVSRIAAGCEARHVSAWVCWCIGGWVYGWMGVWVYGWAYGWVGGLGFVLLHKPAS